jgi:hypothetical protein
MVEIGRHRRLVVALPLVIALLAVVPIIWAMPHALDLSFDSIQYLAAGRNLLAGHGLTVFDAPGRLRPLTHFPPLYPAMLAMFGALAGDVARGAWVLNLTAVSTTVFLVARLAERVAGGEGRARLYAAVVAALATAMTNDLAANAAMLWSEPLFIFLVVVTAALLIHTVDRESKANLRHDPYDPSLVFAAFAAAASVLTRYAGIGIIGGGVLALLFASRLAPKERLRRAAVFGAISTVPLILWLLYNQARAGTATDRELGVHVISRDELWVGLETLSRWFFPYDPSDGYGMLGALLASGIIAYIARETIRRVHGGRDPQTPMAPSQRLEGRDSRSATLVLAILTATYGLVLLASIMFAEHAASLDARLLSPALPLVIALAIGSGCALLCTPLGDLGDRASGRAHPLGALRILAIIVLAASLGNKAIGLASWTRHMPEQSVGLTNLSRSAGELLDVVRALPPSARVYSNMPYMTYAFADRVVSDLPQKISQTSLKPNPDFLTQLHQIAGAPDGHPTYLVFFDSPYHPPFYTTVKDAIVAFPMAEKRIVRGGEVFVIMAQQ